MDDYLKRNIAPVSPVRAGGVGKLVALPIDHRVEKFLPEASLWKDIMRSDGLKIG